ncbi:MAG: N-acetylmuramoyl-L-alanine amidase [Novosphingobium sp.]
MWNKLAQALPPPRSQTNRFPMMRRLVQFLLVILLPVAVFAAMVAADRMFGAPGRGHRYVVRLTVPPSAGEVGLPPIEGPADASRPLVVIDAGHGGHDPGAGTGQIKEKTLALALARALRDELLRGGGIRVALTRSDDRYLLLPERSGIARRLGADLFLSIHADSTERNEASGATVYTLSERGSTDTAQRMADRENRSDTINGVALAGQSDNTSAILVDLSQRDSQARSEEFARLLLREARGKIHMRDVPLQSAAFVVLKSPDVASVLFETGYISNEDDVALLITPEGRATFARVAAKAIRAHFARQSRP